MKISQNEEGHIIRQRSEEDEKETETDRAKEDSLINDFRAKQRVRGEMQTNETRSAAY